ncbi:hypothetical protein BDF20DRAFT_895963 [Mycotypha africana]|uniref:uncharacterized protein n=1 Tax=Mycotypha africana TaxID=64632 RepID=UPI002300B93B|nr:uncharacterized protein BDF20DRAFT_895963 [Mycotypha africana]KAI8968368.1 hypothetical protein BDF20DRAFT_895963 [Mycotypha africana]
MSMSISQILQPESQNPDNSKKKMHSKVKIFYTFKGSDTHCFCTFDIDLDDLNGRKWVGVPLKQCVASVCSSSPDQLVDSNTAVYSANFEESITVENWSHLHDSRSNIIWEGHGDVTNILNDNEKNPLLTGKVVPADEFSSYKFYIEVLLQLHPIRHVQSHSNTNSTEKNAHSYLPPVHSLWSNKLIATSESPLSQSATSYPSSSAVVERPFMSALYHLSESHSSFNLHQQHQQQQYQTKHELRESCPSISKSPLRTEDLLVKEVDQKCSPPYHPGHINTQSSSSFIAKKVSQCENASNKQFPSAIHLTVGNYQSLDKKRKLSSTPRKHQQQQQHQMQLQTPSLGAFSYQNHKQQQQLMRYKSDTGNDSVENSNTDDSKSNSGLTGLHHQHQHHFRTSSAMSHQHTSSFSTPTPTIIRDLSPNNTLMKPSMDTFYHQSRRKKRDTKPPNVNDIRPFVEIERKPDGSYVLPAEVDSWTVLDLGTVIWNKAAFHNQRYIYPVGYRVKKWYRSMVNPHSDTQYTCEILDGGDEPIFQLQADDNPSECWRGPTPTTVWTIAVRRAFAIRNMDYGHNPVGPDFFGLRKNTIAKMIQDLPNADKCKNYIWQNFEAMTHSKGKTVRRNTTTSCLQTDNNSSFSSSGSSNNNNSTPSVSSTRRITTYDSTNNDMLSMHRQQQQLDSERKSEDMVLCEANGFKVN